MNSSKLSFVDSNEPEMREASEDLSPGASRPSVKEGSRNAAMPVMGKIERG